MLVERFAGLLFSQRTTFRTKCHKSLSTIQRLLECPYNNPVNTPDGALSINPHPLQVSIIYNHLNSFNFDIFTYFIRKKEEYVAMPLSEILNEHDFHKLVPAAACLLMLVASGALLELFPELYGLIVRFASSEWKILTKQIAYESSDSGNPVLAVFIAGIEGLIYLSFPSLRDSP